MVGWVQWPMQLLGWAEPHTAHQPEEKRDHPDRQTHAGGHTQLSVLASVCFVESPAETP